MYVYFGTIGGQNKSSPSGVAVEIDHQVPATDCVQTTALPHCAKSSFTKQKIRNISKACLIPLILEKESN